MRIDVLPGTKGHGFVRLVDHMGSDLSIVRSARVSFDADWRTGDDAGKDEKLIRYLMMHHHTSPFESVQFTFEVKAPIFVLRQWHRHRTWAYNEVSARYTELDEGFYIPDPATVGVQSKSNRQAREVHGGDPDMGQRCAWAVKAACKEAHTRYQTMLNDGQPRELARAVLPLATYSRMFASVNLHNLFGFVRLRSAPGAQWETQQYSNALLTLAEEVCPVAVAAFKESV